MLPCPAQTKYMTPRGSLRPSFIFPSISTTNGARKRIKYAAMAVGETRGHLFGQFIFSVGYYFSRALVKLAVIFMEEK